MIQSLNRAVAGEARALMTADAQAETTREWSQEALAKIEQVARPPLVEARTETIEAPTMLRPADAARGRRADGRAEGRRARLPALRRFQA